MNTTSACNDNRFNHKQALLFILVLTVIAVITRLAFDSVTVRAAEEDDITNYGITYNITSLANPNETGDNDMFVSHVISFGVRAPWELCAYIEDSGILELTLVNLETHGIIYEYQLPNYVVNPHTYSRTWYRKDPSNVSNSEFNFLLLPVRYYSTDLEIVQNLTFNKHVKVFSNSTTFLDYVNTGSEDGVISHVRDLDEDGIYRSDIPNPKLVFTDTLKFYISNATDDYNIEIQGRWYSPDDIELYKEDLLWKYRYSSVVKSPLTSWISYSDQKESRGEHNLVEYGQENFNQLLRDYPIENRNYYGGKDPLDNYLHGYNDALITLKTVLLPSAGSLFTGCEIYVRFYYVKDGNAYYGKWTHWYDEMAKSSGSSGSQWDDKENMFTESQSQDGLTNYDKDSLENTGDSKKYDSDAIPSYNNTGSWESQSSDAVWKTVSSMVTSLGDFPALVNTIFGFLPSWVLSMIGVGIAAIVILRFLGR